jgi:hypothetical protein
LVGRNESRYVRELNFSERRGDGKHGGGNRNGSERELDLAAALRRFREKYAAFVSRFTPCSLARSLVWLHQGMIERDDVGFGSEIFSVRASRYETSFEHDLGLYFAHFTGFSSLSNR